VIRAIRLILPLVIIQTALLPTAALADTQVPIAPALVGLDERVNLTAVDVTLGRAAAFLSEQTSYTIVADPRYRDLPVSVAEADGALAEVLSAICLATGMEARRLDRWIVLSPTSRGLAVVGREMRARHAPELARDGRDLSAQRAAAARQALARLGLGGPDQALAQLQDWQRAVLRDQGYLTVAQLFPEYYVPLYDVFGGVIDRRAQRPPSLPEFAGTRLHLDPTLRVELHIPGAGGAGDILWPIDVIPAGGR